MEQQNEENTPRQEEQTTTDNMQSDMTAPAPEPKKSSGAVIGLIVIIIVVLIGLVYFLSNGSESVPSDELPEDETAAELETQGNSDEIDDIAEDLENTNFDDLDTDL